MVRLSVFKSVVKLWCGQVMVWSSCGVVVKLWCGGQVMVWLSVVKLWSG